MNLFLQFIFIFFIGSIFGYVLELCYRTYMNKKLVNPGFLIGPYLPIYGFGLCTLTIIYLIFSQFNTNPLLIILLMGIFMTIIEFVAGLIFIEGAGVKLWDYSEKPLNFKGIICLEFSIYWTILGAIYYYFIANKVISALKWFNNNMSFSFILGIFFGLIILDTLYSTNTLVKISRFAKDNDFIVKYEEFKKHIKDIQIKRSEKYSFIFPFKQSLSLSDYLNLYKKNNTSINNFKLFKMFRKR